MTDQDAQKIQRTLGQIEGKLASHMKSIETLLERCDKRHQEIKVDTNNIWASIGRHGERIAACETELNTITKEALRSGAKGGGVVAGVGGGILFLVVIFFKYVLPYLNGG